MKICIQMLSKNSDRSLTGKGKFFKRLRAEFEKMGIEVTYDPKKKVDIDVCINKPLWWPKNSKRKVIRLGPCEYDSNRKDLKECWHVARKYAKSCHGIIYQSAFSKMANHAFLRTSGLCDEAVIHNGSTADGAMHTFGLAGGGPHFLASTREWTLEKSLDTIIEAFLDAAIPQSTLHVCGTVWDKPKRFPLENRKLLKKYGKQVIFLGETSQEDLNAYYYQCAALIHLVYWDSCANAVAEAMQFGIPIICGDNCGTMEYINKERGIIVPFNKSLPFKPWNRRKPPKVDKNVLSEAMWKIKDFPRYDPPDEFHISAIAKKYKEFFEGVLG